MFLFYDSHFLSYLSFEHFFLFAHVTYAHILQFSHFFNEPSFMSESLNMLSLLSMSVKIKILCFINLETLILFVGPYQK